MINLCYEDPELYCEGRVAQRIEHVLVSPALTAEEASGGLALIRINDVLPMHLARAIASVVAQHGEFAVQDQKARRDPNCRQIPSRSGGMGAGRSWCK